MKINTTILAVGILSAVSLAFGQSTNAPSASNATNSIVSAAATKTEFQQPFPVLKYKLEKKGARSGRTDKIERLGKDSSQAWTTIAGQQPDLTVFQDCRTHEPRFCLWSSREEPWW